MPRIASGFESARGSATKQEKRSSFMSDHWNSLANLLGTPSFPPQNRKSDGGSNKKGAAASVSSEVAEPKPIEDLVEPPTSAIEPEESVSAKPEKSRLRSSWDAVASFFGVASSDADASEASEPSAAKAASPSEASRKTSSANPDPRAGGKKSKPSMWSDGEVGETRAADPEPVSKRPVERNPEPTRVREPRDVAPAAESNESETGFGFGAERRSHRRPPRRGRGGADAVVEPNPSSDAIASRSEEPRHGRGSHDDESVGGRGVPAEDSQEVRSDRRGNRRGGERREREESRGDARGETREPRSTERSEERRPRRSGSETREARSASVEAPEVARKGPVTRSRDEDGPEERDKDRGRRPQRDPERVEGSEGGRSRSRDSQRAPSSSGRVSEGANKPSGFGFGIDEDLVDSHHAHDDDFSFESELEMDEPDLVRDELSGDSDDPESDEARPKRRRRRRRGTRDREEGESRPRSKSTRTEEDRDAERNHADEEAEDGIRLSKVPSWTETIMVVVEANIANHQRNPGHGRGPSRGRGRR